MMKYNMKIQNKNFNFELKEVSDEGIFSGYASVFDVVDLQDDKVEKGAFENTIKNKMPAILWQHNASDVIGVCEKIEEDTTGLYLEGRLLLGIEKAREAFILLKNRAIKSLSIGYHAVQWEWREEDGRYIRILKELDLWEISLVTFPANELAIVDDVKGISNTRDAEKFLREAGFSRTQAKAVIAGIKSGIRCDDEDDEAIVAAKNLLYKIQGV